MHQTASSHWDFSTWKWNSHQNSTVIIDNLSWRNCGLSNLHQWVRKSRDNGRNLALNKQLQPGRSVNAVLYRSHITDMFCVLLFFCIYLYCCTYATCCTFQLLFMNKLRISCWVNDLTKSKPDCACVKVHSMTGHCAEACSRAFQNSEIRDSGMVISPWTPRDLCFTTYLQEDIADTFLRDDEQTRRGSRQGRITITESSPYCNQTTLI